VEEIKLEKLHPVSVAMGELIQTLKDFKPEDRSEIDRRFAIAITDAEKLAGYVITYLGVYLERTVNK